jgi:outer membrane protein insertion porin family
LGAKISTYSISWLDPYFRDSLWRLGFEVSKNFSSLQSKHYDIHTLNFTVNASYPFWTYWAFGTKYRIRDARVHIKRHGEPGAMAAERRENGEEGIISSAGPSISYDSTDSMLKPRRGYRSYFDTEFAGLGGDFTFWRFNYLNNFYYPLWRLGTLKYRFDFHFIDPIWKSRHFREIPLTERFFLGGDASVRGYRAFDLGPEKKGDPDGGISSSLLSVEYLQYVFKVLDAFVFVDSGAVSQKRFHIAKYNVSYGAGVRLEVLQRLPIILGMGFPVNPDRPSQVRRFFFSMGGQF